MPSLSKWLQEKREARQIKKGLTHPVLPSPRPGTITPSSSQSSSLPVTPPNGPFFTTLPSELRHQILLSALGARSLHIDLSFDHPVARIAPSRYQHYSHAGTASDGRGALLRERTRPKAWRWESSACHRNGPGPDPYGRPMSGDEGPRGPWNDRCRQGYGDCCGEYPGELPHKCHVGAMGWLLACRQAYVEGIDVLYSTNNFVIQTELTLLHLPSLILPQRLLALSSLEISWPLKINHHHHPDDNPVLDEAHYASLFTCLTAHLTHLSRLYLSLEPDPCLTQHFARWLDPERLLKPVDRLVEARGGSAPWPECAVAIPTTLFEKVWATTRGKLWCHRQVWRFLDGEHVVTEARNRLLNPYPNPPSRPPEEDGGSQLGYWVLDGKSDGPNHIFMCTMGTGL